MLSVHGIKVGSKTCLIIFLGLRFEVVDIMWAVIGEKEACGAVTCEMAN